MIPFDPSEIPRRGAQLDDIIRTKPAMVQGQFFPEATLEVIQRDGSRRTVRVTESPFLIGHNARSVQPVKHLATSTTSCCV